MIFIALGVVVIVGIMILLTTTTMDQNFILANENDEHNQITPKDTPTTTAPKSEIDPEPTPAQKTQEDSREPDSNSSNTSTTREDTDPYDLTIEAESAIVLDAETGEVLFEKQPNAERPLASITKLMTALVGTKRMDEVPDGEVEISRQHLNAAGSNGLVAGQTWKVDELISFMLMESSNDAARAVAAASSNDQDDGYAKEFVEAMNDNAEALDLSTTYFFNPSGLDLNETLVSGGYGSAQDVARLFEHILDTNASVLDPTTESSRTFSSEEGVDYYAQNTNTALPEFRNVLGSKTGYTVLAGGNLVMGFEFEHPVVIAVLGSSRNGRFQDMKKLYKATGRYFEELSDGNIN